MPYIPVPNTAQVELVYQWNGQFVQNVLHYTKASPWTIEHLQEVADEAADIWTANFPPIMPLTLSLIQVKATDLSSQTGPSITEVGGLPVAGTSVSPSLPNNVSLVITKRTALRGRSYRGRIYHVGLSENQVVDSAVPAANVTTIVNLWNNFLAIPMPLAADEALLVVVSRFNEGAPRATGVANLVLNLTSDGVVDSQRRRLPGRGR